MKRPAIHSEEVFQERLSQVPPGAGAAGAGAAGAGAAGAGAAGAGSRSLRRSLPSHPNSNTVTSVAISALGHLPMAVRPPKDMYCPSRLTTAMWIGTIHPPRRQDVGGKRQADRRSARLPRLRVHDAGRPPAPDLARLFRSLRLRARELVGLILADARPQPETCVAEADSRLPRLDGQVGLAPLPETAEWGEDGRRFEHPERRGDRLERHHRLARAQVHGSLLPDRQHRDLLPALVLRREFHVLERDAVGDVVGGAETERMG